MGQQLQGVNFTNILQAAFKHTDYAQRSQKLKKIDSLTVFLHFWDLCLQKLNIKCWWNRPQDRNCNDSAKDYATKSNVHKYSYKKVE